MYTSQLPRAREALHGMIFFRAFLNAQEKKLQMLNPGTFPDVYKDQGTMCAVDTERSGHGGRRRGAVH